MYAEIMQASQIALLVNLKPVFLLLVNCKLYLN